MQHCGNSALLNQRPVQIDICNCLREDFRVNVTCLLILPSHQPTSIQFKDTSEAAVAGVKSIAESCIRSGTVRRLIYTATVMAASPMKDDAKCFAEAMDESCWTPLNLSGPHSSEQFMVLATGFCTPLVVQNHVFH